MPKKKSDMQKRMYNRVGEILLQEGRSQKWLAARAGIHVNSMSSIVRNNSQPTLVLLFDLAQALNRTPCELLGNGELMEKKIN